MSDDSCNCQILILNRDHCVASWYNVVIGIWAGQPDIESLKKTLQLERYLYRKYHQELVSLQVCRKGMPLFHSEMNCFDIETIQKSQEMLIVNAIVLEGEGRWASDVRGMVSKFSEHANIKQYKFFSAVREAADHLQPRFARDAGTPKALSTFVDTLKMDMVSFPSNLQ